MASLPQDFKEFCEVSGVDQREYNHLGKLPRYVRCREDTMEKREGTIREAFGDAAERVPYFTRNAMWSLPHRTPLQATRAHADSRICGIDLGSALCVAALDPVPGERVLDLCCAPGAKLLFVADLVGDDGEVTGVDIDLQRLYVAKAAVTKAGRTNVRLVLADGARYDPAKREGNGPWWDERGRSLAATNPSKLRKALAKHYPSAPPGAPEAGVVVVESQTRKQSAMSRKRERDDDEEQTGFDRVLVDAECTTDGSLRHVEKMAATCTEWKEKSPWVGDPQGLRKLQVALLRRGVAMVRPGGVVVYATCSLATQQNEEVVKEVLRGDASLSVVPLFDDTHSGVLDPAHPVPSLPSTALPGACLFTPSHLRCGGLFCAKLRKKDKE